MNDIQNRIEAILFTTGRFMDLEEISRLCGIGSIGIVKENVEGLREVFKGRESSLEIIEDNGKFKLSIRKDYVHLTAKLLNDTEFDRPAQETLAIIAYKQPILQSDVIKIRGNKAYEHIHTLKETEFIISEKHGRTRMLKVAPKFYEYFDTALDALKENFMKVEQKVGSVQRLNSVEEAKANAAENEEIMNKEALAKKSEQDTGGSKEIEDSGNKADEEESTPAKDETANESKGTKTKEEQNSKTPESDKQKEEPEECSFDL